MKPIETARLVLREVEPTDAGFFVRILNDPLFLRFIGDRGVRTEQEARDYLAAAEPPAIPGLGPRLVVRKADQEAIGLVTLLQRDYLDAVDLGFAFVQGCHGQGFGHEASLALRDHAVHELRLNPLLAVTDPDNVASCRLLEKLGFELAGTVTVAPGEECKLFRYDASV